MTLEVKIFKIQQRLSVTCQEDIFYRKSFNTSEAMNLCKYHVFSKGSFGREKFAFVTIVYKAWFLLFHVVVSMS